MFGFIKSLYLSLFRRICFISNNEVSVYFESMDERIAELQIPNVSDKY